MYLEEGEDIMLHVLSFFQVELCLECIEWAKSEKRTFLRQALEVGAYLSIDWRYAALDR